MKSAIYIYPLCDMPTCVGVPSFEDEKTGQGYTFNYEPDCKNCWRKMRE